MSDTDTERPGGDDPPGLDRYLDRYLDGVLDLIEAQALHAARVDWPRTRTRARDVAAGATRPADTYGFLRDVLRELDDDHSFLESPADAVEALLRSPPMPEGERLETPCGDPVVRVVVPWHTNTATLSGADFADGLRGIVAEHDGSDVARWIVDLRTNGGGNMWPMLLGLEPLLDGPTVGWFVDRAGGRSRWSVDQNSACIDDAVVADGCRVHVRRRRDDCRIAVLAGPGTASSGEAVAVAFQGLGHARRFGAATSGLASGNSDEAPPCGATLYLTTVRFADRTGRVVPDRLWPDDVCDDPCAAALAWLGR